jgi:5-methyltetrahydropteroyltriglutamate--homocysteine methyltransferase
MRQSTERILTTHTGSLPRPPSLQNLLYAREQGTEVDQSSLEKQIQEAVTAVVAQQVACGLDVVNDGEMSKISYSTYVKDRLSGFQETDGLPPNFLGALELLEFPEYAQQMFAATPIASLKFPHCVAPVAYVGTEQLQRDLTNLKAALQDVDPSEVFMTAPSPGIVTVFLHNDYYQSQAEYLEAIATAMKTEYDAIVQAGFLLQLDCPDLSLTGTVSAMLRKQVVDTESEVARLRMLHIEALNHATRDIPPERMRLHMCWGNYEGPHHYDPPLRDLIGPLLQARPSALVLTAANPRHQHEWQLFETMKLPEDKLLVLGVLDSTTNFIEHPELIAQRLVRMARLIGRERVIAGTDCGFATFAGLHRVDPKIAWAKLQAMAEGARLASQQLW